MPNQGGRKRRTKRRHQTFYSILKRMEELEREREELDRKHSRVSLKTESTIENINTETITIQTKKPTIVKKETTKKKNTRKKIKIYYQDRDKILMRKKKKTTKTKKITIVNPEKRQVYVKPRKISSTHEEQPSTTIDKVSLVKRLKDLTEEHRSLSLKSPTIITKPRSLLSCNTTNSKIHVFRPVPIHSNRTQNEEVPETTVNRTRRAFRRRISLNKNEEIVDAEMEGSSTKNSHGVTAVIRSTMLPVERRFDHEFYFIKIQIRANEGSLSLQHWRFEVCVSDRQSDKKNTISSTRYRRNFSNLHVDPKDGMICFSSSTVFGDVARKTLSPTQDLKWLRTSYPVQLYGKALHIQVRATYPFRVSLLDRYVVFCCVSDNPILREDVQNVITPKSPLASFRSSPTRFEFLKDDDEEEEKEEEEHQVEQNIRQLMRMKEERWDACTTEEDDVARYVEKQKKAEEEAKKQQLTENEHHFVPLTRRRRIVKLRKKRKLRKLRRHRRRGG